VLRVIYETDKAFAPTHIAISSDVDDELISDSLFVQARSSLFDLDENSLLLEEEIDAGGFTCIARRPLFTPDVLEEQGEEAAKEILYVVFIGDVERGSFVVSAAELDGDRVKPTEHETKLINRLILSVFDAFLPAASSLIFFAEQCHELTEWCFVKPDFDP